MKWPRHGDRKRKHVFRIEVVEKNQDEMNK